jgi:hypothetical protein
MDIGIFPGSLTYFSANGTENSLCAFQLEMIIGHPEGVNKTGKV